MKAVTRYEANDGSLHVQPDDALARDRIIAQVDSLMAALEPIPTDDGCRFANGHGWVQQRPEVVATVKRGLIDLGEPWLGWWYEKQRTEHGKTLDDLLNAHASWFGRMLDGSCPPLEYAWHRMCAIADDGREFGQPFYANNPDKADGGPIPPKES